MSRRRLSVIAVLLIVAGGLPLAGYVLLEELGLLTSVAVVQVLLLGLVLRVWLSLDGSVHKLTRQLRRDVGRMSRRVEKDLTKVDLRGFRRSTEEMVNQVRMDRETTVGRLLEHERQLWELHRETLRQMDAGFHAQKDELKRRHEQTTRQLTSRLGDDFAQVEGLLALYYDLRPAVAFPATRSWAASPDLLRHLYDRVRLEQPQLILECGSGLSTVVMAYAIRHGGYDGRVIALEHLDDFARTTRRMLADHGFDDLAEVRLAPLRDLELEGEVWPWYDLEQLPDAPVDLLFVDGPPGATHPQARYPALPALRSRLAPGATVILDDYRRDDEAGVAQRWLGSVEGLQLQELRHEKGTAIFTFVEDAAQTSELPPAASRDSA